MAAVAADTVKETEAHHHHHAMHRTAVEVAAVTTGDPLVAAFRRATTAITMAREAVAMVVAAATAVDETPMGAVAMGMSDSVCQSYSFWKGCALFAKLLHVVKYCVYHKNSQTCSV